MPQSTCVPLLMRVAAGTGLETQSAARATVANASKGTATVGEALINSSSKSHGNGRSSIHGSNNSNSNSSSINHSNSDAAVLVGAAAVGTPASAASVGGSLGQLS